MKLETFKKYFLPEWWEFLQPILQESLLEIMTGMRNEYKQHTVYPNSRSIFTAFKYTPFDRLKVVIIGQDPYPTPGHAHGLAFSSLSLDRPKSLGNIFRAVQSDYFMDTVAPYDEVCVGNDLTQWASQGVLLLNRTLTVRKGEPKSHKDIWRDFVPAVVLELQKHPNPLIWLLWGSEAQELKPYITHKHHVVLEGPHPVSRTESFEVEHFTEANNWIDKTFKKKKSPINWGVYKDNGLYYIIDIEYPDGRWPELSVFFDRYYDAFLKSFCNTKGFMMFDKMPIEEGIRNVKQIAKYLYKTGRGDAPTYIKPRNLADQFKKIALHKYPKGCVMNVSLASETLPF